MHAAKAEIEPMVMGEYEGRLQDLGEWRVAWETLPAGFPPDPAAFRGLPDDRCQCHHLGLVVKGSFRVTYLDGTEEIVAQGEAYSLAAGHFVQALEHTEVVEFSPREEHDRTMRQVMENVAAANA